MKIKPSIHFSLLAFGVFLFSFIQPAQAHPSRFYNALAVLGKNKTDTGGGQVVRLDLIEACVAKYDSLMQAHGFSATAGQAVDLHITSTAMITNSETFNGKKLQDWINSTAKEYSKAGKIFMVKIQLGIYDMNYLNVYETNPSLRAQYNNRIAVFLIPVDGSTGKTFQSAAMVAAGGTGGTGGGTGYDFGGIQP
jgi:hypothetical protein